MNLKEPVHIHNEQIPVVEEKYKYLGTSAGPRKLSGITEQFTQIQKTVTIIMESHLTPMQKMHAMRTRIVPKLYHLLQNSSPLYSELVKINKYMRRTIKQLCYLPTNASNNYIHLDRLFGGPGIPDILWLRKVMVISNILDVWNGGDELSTFFKEITESQDLIDVIEKINKNTKAGLHPMLKELAQAIKTLAAHLQKDVKLTSDENQVIRCVVGSAMVAKPWATLKAELRRKTLEDLASSPNQGRFWRTLVETPGAVRGIYNFHTPMCDWRFIHRARLNLTPLRGAVMWADIDKTCRRCQGAQETLAHVLNNCPVRKPQIIRRHNDVRDAVAEAIPNTYQYMKEERFGNLQPDLIIQNTKDRTMRIIDIKVSSDTPEAFIRNDKNNQSKYEPLRNQLRQQNFKCDVVTFQVGALGSISVNAKRAILSIIKCKRKATGLIRKISRILVHHSRNSAVEHITGVTQV